MEGEEKSAQFPANYLAMQMAKKKLEMLERDKEREVQRKTDYAALVDPSFDYSPSLEDFMQEVNACHPTRKGTPYMQFLRENKKRYGNSSAYYLVWGGSPALERKGDEHRAIVSFISDELKREASGYDKKDENSTVIEKDGQAFLGLKDELKNLVLVAEANAIKGEKIEISKWPKIKCAAFVEIMFDKNWFELSDRIKTLSNFALIRYGHNIGNQLAGAKKESRDAIKRRFKKYF